MSYSQNTLSRICRVDLVSIILEYWKRSSENNCFHFEGVDTEPLFLITLALFVQVDPIIVETKQRYWWHKYLTNVILEAFVQREKWVLNYCGGFKYG